MNSHNSQHTWKIVLAVFGAGLLLVTLFYSNYLASELRKIEEKNKQLYIKATKKIVEESDNYEQDISILLDFQETFALPNIIDFGEEEDLEAFNWGEKRDNDQVFLRKKIKSFLEKGGEPIDYPQGDGKLYVFNSPLVKLIQYYPLVQVFLVGLFIALGYYLFSTGRKAEQNRVWAGMAKETAHQLGTPISAILAWIEFLKEGNVDRPDQLEVVGELEKDVERLELIADRFSKIGSDPELELTNIYDQLDAIETYMKRRASRKVKFDFPKSEEMLSVNVNQHLFSWVLENLIRNALDAMDGAGTISASVSTDAKEIQLLLSDTGKGIPSGKFNEVFKPGFSTKKRGWGLGLSLAKRIIEDYHKGKIFVKQSKVNEGTTFAIHLPRVS